MDIDKQIAELEAQLAPEPTQEEREAQEKRDRVVVLQRRLRTQKIERTLVGAREASNGMFLLDAVDLDERAELDPKVMSWFVVRGCSRAEQKAFEDAQAEQKIDNDNGRAKLLVLVKSCVVAPKLDTSDQVLAFEDAVNKRFGMALVTLVQKIMHLGGHREAKDRAFR